MGLEEVQGAFVEAGTSSYFVRRLGAGPPLLFVHGFPLSGLTWRQVIDTFAAHFECIVPDLPGLGATEYSPATDFSFPGQGEGLKRLVDALGLEGYAIVAQDTGGTFARYLALGDPRARAIALINTEVPGHRPPWIPFYQQLLRMPGAERVLGALTRSRRFVRSPMGFGGCFDDLDLLEGDFDRLFIEPLRRSHRAQIGVRHYLRGAKWQPVDALASLHAMLEIPVRLVWGVDDPTFPIAEAREMVGQFPRADLVEIPDAKLLPHEEQPAAVIAATLDWLRT